MRYINTRLLLLLLLLHRELLPRVAILDSVAVGSSPVDCKSSALTITVTITIDHYWMSSRSHLHIHSHRLTETCLGALAAVW